MNKLARVASRLLYAPLAIEPRKAVAILNAIGPRVLGLEALTPPDWTAVEQQDGPPYATTPDGIAVVGIDGSLVRRASGLEALSGLTTYDQLSATFAAAAADPQVRAILMRIDSPGGEVSGLLDLADQIRAIGTQKPIWASVDDMAASAAYALTAAASRISVTQTSDVGSIGVIAMHVDQSGYDAQQGLAFTSVYAGARKNDLNPHGPPTPEALAVAQGRVDQAYQGLVASIAKSRPSLTEAAIRGTEAGLFYGPAAVDAGLADTVGTYDQTLAAMSAWLAERRPRGAALPTFRTSPMSGISMADVSLPTPEQGVGQPAAVPAVATSNVVELDAARTAGRAEAIAYFSEVGDLCSLAGMPNLAAGFIAKSTPIAEVRNALLTARAAKADAVGITSTHPGDGAPVDPAAGWDRAMAKAGAWRKRAIAQAGRTFA
jgi:signal peptide peptidase SppA